MLVPSRDFVIAFGHPIHVAPDLVFIKPKTKKVTFFFDATFSVDAPAHDIPTKEIVDNNTIVNAMANRLTLIRFIRELLLFRLFDCYLVIPQQSNADPISIIVSSHRV